MSFASQIGSVFTIAAVSAGLHSLAAQSAAPESEAHGIRFNLGAGVMTAPRYEGSDEYQVKPLPLARIEISDKVFLGFGVVGVYLVQQDGFTGTLGVTVRDPRSSSSADALAGTDKHNLGAWSVSSIEYRRGWIATGVSGARSLGERGGYNLESTFGVTVPMTSRLSLGVNLKAMFSDRRSMAYDFGVSQREAERRSELIERGDHRLRPGEGRAYRPGAGLRSFGVGGTAGYQAGRRWALVGLVEISRLGNQAAASPLVRNRNGIIGGVGVTFAP